MLEPRPEEFDELPDHAVLAQLLGNGQHEIRGRRAFEHRSGEPEADDLRNEHRDRLAEHGGFGFDPADAPADHAQAVHHRGV